MSLRDKIAGYNALDAEQNDKLKKNPFSDKFEQQSHSKDDKRYGRPTEGSKTEKRGIKAGWCHARVGVHPLGKGRVRVILCLS